MYIFIVCILALQYYFTHYLRLKSPLVQPDIEGNAVKYLVYSAHDTTLSAALIAMDTWDNVQPYYASGMCGVTWVTYHLAYSYV